MYARVRWAVSLVKEQTVVLNAVGGEGCREKAPAGLVMRDAVYQTDGPPHAHVHHPVESYVRRYDNVDERAPQWAAVSSAFERVSSIALSK